jgi:hypothetical protein
MLSEVQLTWLAIGIAVGGVLALIVSALNKSARARIDRETAQWLRRHRQKGESYDR